MIILQLLAIWFGVSIIFSLILGAFLGLTNPSPAEKQAAMIISVKKGNKHIA